MRTELQADCYAGVWAHYAAITKQPGTDVTFLEPLSDKDIQRRPVGRLVGGRRPHPEGSRPAGSTRSRGRTVPPSSGRHWFTAGYQTGDPNKCDTFSARDLDTPLSLGKPPKAANPLGIGGLCGRPAAATAGTAP